MCNVEIKGIRAVPESLVVELNLCLKTMQNHLDSKYMFSLVQNFLLQYTSPLFVSCVDMRFQVSFKV